MLTVPRLAATKRSTAPSDNLVDDAELNRATAPLAPLVDLPLVAPLHAEPRAPEEVPDDESAASALLAFLSAARTEAPVIAPEAPDAELPKPIKEAATEEVTQSATTEEEQRNIKSTHWSGIERPPPLVAVDNDEDYEARRIRVNHMRRCNEDMRILMLGWRAVEVDNPTGKSTQKVYEHPDHGRVMSKKEIFRIHKGERIDFSTNQAQTVCTHVRSARSTHELVDGMLPTGNGSDTQYIQSEK